MRWIFMDVPAIDSFPDVRALRDFIQRHDPAEAFIENVGIRSGQGSQTKFAAAFGALQAAVTCCDVPITRIAPQRWKAYFGLLNGKKKMKQNEVKEASRIKAIELAPELFDVLAAKSEFHGRAEAALLAIYAASDLASP